MTLKTKPRDDDRSEGVPLPTSAMDAPRVEAAGDDLSAATFVDDAGLARGASRRAPRPLLIPATDRNPVWITISCGQRFCTDQIGSMFGRE